MDQVLYGIDQQDFNEMIKRGYVYVDKTGYIPQLLTKTFYFLGRPRRFGKSLFVSTLEHFFNGHRELFKGLAIEDYPWDWEKYPVLRIDFSNGSFSKETGLEERLYELMSRFEREYDIHPVDGSPRARFQNLIDSLIEKTGRKVVILIDEYEKPLLEAFGRGHFSAFRDELSDFYSVFKDNESKIRFLFITGITRFGHVNIFSGINNLTDISLNPKFNSICGITDEEIHRYLSPGIEEFAAANNSTIDQTLQLLKQRYDGYHFSASLQDVYNPFTLLRCLDFGMINDAWATTGSSKYLIKIIRGSNFDLSEIDGTQATGRTLMGVDAEFMDPVPLLYQSGYLTIKSYDPRTFLYTLGIPNQEVREELMESIIPYYLGRDIKFANKEAFQLLSYINDGKADAMMSWLKSFFSKVAYSAKFKYVELQHERDFQLGIGMMFALVASLDDITFEQETSQGRIDLVLTTRKYVYVFEFKLDNNAQAAIHQINSREYSLPWEAGGRKVFKIGVAFSAAKRCITDYIIQHS